MIENHWQLQDAKNKFSNLVDKAQHNGPQIVTKHGKYAVVVKTVGSGIEDIKFDEVAENSRAAIALWIETELDDNGTVPPLVFWPIT